MQSSGRTLFVTLSEYAAFPILRVRPYNLHANGGDRLRQGFGRPTDVMPGYSMQLVKTRREKTIANKNELALGAQLGSSVSPQVAYARGGRCHSDKLAQPFGP